MFEIVYPKKLKIKASYVEFDHSIRTFKYEDVEGVDLFPYKIKNRSKFYQRGNHPIDINPESYLFSSYWEAFEKKCIEGEWINDDGTWVYFMPKLFYYTNYVKIRNDDRNQPPDVSSLEWILFSYFLIIDGFSGFQDDEEYTCHDTVLKLCEGYDINDFELEKLPKSCYKKNGELKTYVDAWEYLTRFYLLDNPSEKPLGHPLYFNNRKNGLIMGGRGLSKSLSVFLGDFPHEWTWGSLPVVEGLRLYKNVSESGSRLFFTMASGNSAPLKRTIQNVKAFYNSQPGKFKYPNPDKQDYMGPFYKNYQGQWDSGKSIEHIVKNKSNKDVIVGSSLQMSVITPDQKNLGAGDRFRRMYIEEIGFIEYILEVAAVNKDSMEVGDRKVGSMIGVGTAGDMKSIMGSKTMMENPKAYGIACTTDYYKNVKRSIGLFLPSYYRFREDCDPQGNNRLQYGLSKILEGRKVDLNEVDSATYDTRVMFNPIILDEMLRPNRKSILPVREAQEQLANIEAYDIFNEIATIGDLKYNPLERYGVEFVKDQNKILRPILQYSVDRSKIDERGAFVVYEHPPTIIPEGLYYVVFDPVRDDGKGTSKYSSLNSVIVYKWFYSGSEKTMEDTIVAEWIGREETVEMAYERVIKLCKYFNAKIFPERNTAGFIKWCYNKNHSHLLQPECVELERELNPKFKQGYHKVGFYLDERKKIWALRKLHDWLVTPKILDEKTGVPVSRNINHIYSLRILEEIINFINAKNHNFDHISSLLGLMLLIGHLDREGAIPLTEEIEKEEEPVYVPKLINRRRRSSFETY